MSRDAIESWGEVHKQVRYPFHVWMGEMILYCEKVEALLE